jgi:hypothetical protein
MKGVLMYKLVRVLISLGFIFSSFSISVAQPILNWKKIYDYNHLQDIPNQIIVDDSGNIYIIGHTEISNAPATNFDALILKYDPYGNLLWYKLKHLANWGGMDIYLKAVLTEDGNIFVSGEMQVDNTSKMYNVLFSPGGNVLREDTRSYSTYWPYKCRNIFYSDSSYYITDVFYENDKLKIVILHYSNQGYILSVNESQEFDGGPENIAFSDSSILLTYTKRNSDYQYHSIIKKLSLSGQQEWETVLSDTLLSIMSVKSVTDINNNIYSICNRVNIDTSAYYLTKLDSQGNIIWDTNFLFNDGYYGGAVDLTILNSGLIKIVGTSTYWNGTSNEWGMFVALYDSIGNLLDYKKHLLPYIVQNYSSPKYDKFGNVYWSFGIQNSLGYLDILIIKIDQDGELEEEFVYSHNNNQTYNEEPIDMFIVDEDNYVISACGGGLTEMANIMTLRYGSTFTSIVSDTNRSVTSYNLDQNYPNPFNPGTTISWQSSIGSWQTIKMFNSLGQEIATIVDGYYEAGIHSKLYIVNSSLPSGVYFYQLKAGNYLETKKMILLK